MDLRPDAVNSMAAEQDAQKRYEDYRDERKALIDAARESARTFDQAMLAFGSVVFGFSIGFIKEVAPNRGRSRSLGLQQHGGASLLLCYSSCFRSSSATELVSLILSVREGAQ
jgi:hypothetical protein